MRIGNADGFAFDIEWINDRSLGDHLPRAEAATWASIRIHASGQVLTANVDTAAGYSEVVFGSPLSLCIWALQNWSSLIGSERRPTKSRFESPFEYLDDAESALDDTDEGDQLAEEIRRWWESHNLRGGRSGMALPDLYLWRQGPWMLLWWRTDEIRFGQSNLRFLPGEGRAQLDAAGVARAFLELCEVVEERLNSQGVSDEDWRSEEFRRLYRDRMSSEGGIRMVVEESGLSMHQFSVVSGIAQETLSSALQGEVPASDVWTRVADAFDLPEQPRDPGLLAASIGSGVLALFRSAAPTLRDDDVVHLMELIRKGKSGRGSAERLDELQRTARRSMPDSDGRAPYAAHRVGQARARAVREALALSPTDPVDVEAVLVELLQRRIETCALSDVSIDGVSLWSRTINPIVAINSSSLMGSTEWGRRMALAHELCHLVFDSSAGRALGIASGEWAPLVLEKVANAFAAEFLLPRAALDAWPDSLDLEHSFARLMEEYGVGVTVAAHQARNHGFISDSVAQYYMNARRSPPD